MNTAPTTPTFTAVHPDLADQARTLAHSTTLGLAPGSRMLVTTPVLEVLTELGDVLTERDIVLIDGPSGSGKTLLEHLMMARATQLGATAVRVQAGRRPSGKKLSASILRSLRPDVRIPATQNQTEDELKRCLAAPRQALVVYDEAQHLGVRGIEDIRYYWDETPGQFPLVLSGVNVTRLLNGHPQLEDRIGFRYTLTLLDPAASVAFATAFHPLLADIVDRDPGLLADINHTGVRGTPRRWSWFVKHAQFTLARTGTNRIDDAIAYTALARFTPATQLQTWRRTRPAA